MKTDILNTVNLFLEKYRGGEEFYNALDEQIRVNDIWLYAMLAKIEEDTYDGVVVSGKFGRRFYKFVEEQKQELASKILVANGSLRNGNSIGIEDQDLTNKKFIFIDDSFWAGRTRNVVKDYIERNHGTLLKTYVFYDGSKIKEKEVESFYRYYDYH